MMKLRVRIGFASAFFIFCIAASFLMACELPVELQGVVERKSAQGTIAGEYYTHNGYECQRYLGIPYAKAPVGDLRFRPPQDPDSYKDGRLEAFSNGPMCPQLVDGFISGDEDCLFLNIYTPEDAKPGDKYPVMFFIHGGSNELGNGNQAIGDFIGMAEQANALNGLNGLFEQLKTIALLDANLYDGAYLASKYRVVLVTINYRLGALGHFAHPSIGEGSGNFAFLDMLKALKWVNTNIPNFGGDTGNVTIFGQSSGAWDVCALMNMPAAKGLFHKAIMESQSCLSRSISQAENYGKSNIKNCYCDDEADVAKCMREASLGKLLKSTALQGSPYGFITNIPAIDGKIFPKHFAESIKTDQFNHVPLIIGNNQNELAIPLATDIGFNCPLDANLAIFAKYLKAPIYQYRFDHRPLTNLMPVLHVFELPYVFGSAEDLFNGSKRELAVCDIVSAYWARFAYTSNPNDSGQVYWPQYDRESQRFLRLNSDPYEDSGSIVGVPYNCTLAAQLLPTIMGEQIVFW